MNNLVLEPSAKTPQVEFKSDGNLLVRGRSIPENSVEFYQPILDWIEAYASSPSASTKVNMQLEYFNTSSSKCILDLFKKLETVTDTEMNIYWYYEEDDEDMLEAGEDYDAIINLNFNMVAVEEL